MSIEKLLMIFVISSRDFRSESFLDGATDEDDGDDDFSSTFSEDDFL